jgi:hypothetical protein
MTRRKSQYFADVGHFSPRALAKGYDVVMLVLHRATAMMSTVWRSHRPPLRQPGSMRLPNSPTRQITILLRTDASNCQRYGRGAKGHVKFGVGDFFARDWDSGSGRPIPVQGMTKRFPLIYD